MPVDWFEIFAFSVPPLELFVGGSAIYLFLLTFRTILKRDLGAIGVADVHAPRPHRRRGPERDGGRRPLDR
jgi:hypothetical protein